MPNAAYLRHPGLHGDKLVFVSDDDLWLAHTEGGPAIRLTAGLSEPSTPCFSDDGRWIAYVSRDEHHPEVHLMAADGGQSRRLTWLGPDVMVRGWTPNGQIVFVTTQGQPFFRNYRAFTVDPAGGLPRMLAIGQVNHLAYDRRHPTQRRLIGRNTADPARWKRYRGGTAGHLWVDELGNGQFRRLALAGNISSPMWLGERIFYLSDAQGIGNLYSCRARWRRCAAPHRSRPSSTRAMRKPTASASSISTPAICGCTTRLTTAHAACRSTCPAIAARARAGSSRRPTICRVSSCIRKVTAWPSMCAASCSRCRCGKARCVSTARPTTGA